MSRGRGVENKVLCTETEVGVGRVPFDEEDGRSHLRIETGLEWWRRR